MIGFQPMKSHSVTLVTLVTLFLTYAHTRAHAHGGSYANSRHKRHASRGTGR